jgi:hypothetical protein
VTMIADFLDAMLDNDPAPTVRRPVLVVPYPCQSSEELTERAAEYKRSGAGLMPVAFFDENMELEPLLDSERADLERAGISEIEWRNSVERFFNGSKSNERKED